MVTIGMERKETKEYYRLIVSPTNEKLQGDATNETCIIKILSSSSSPAEQWKPGTIIRLMYIMYMYILLYDDYSIMYDQRRTLPTRQKQV